MSTTQTTLPGHQRSAAWRVAVRGEADRLVDDLSRVVAGTDQTVQRIGSSVDRLIAGARTTAETPSSPYIWWSGSSVDTARGRLWRAREDLVLIQDAAELECQRGYLESLIHQQTPAPTDSVVKALQGTSWDLPQRLAARQLLIATHLRISQHHAATRGFRNMAIIVAGLLAVALAGASIVVSIFDTSISVAAVTMVGALAGLLTAAVPLARTPQLPMPYSTVWAQALLKPPAGATAALVGIVLIHGGLPGFTSTGLGSDLFYSAIFGAAQQLVTQMVDNQAGVLARTGKPAPSPSSTPATPPPPAGA